MDCSRPFDSVDGLPSCPCEAWPGAGVGCEDDTAEWFVLGAAIVAGAAIELLSGTVAVAGVDITLDPWWVSGMDDPYEEPVRGSIPA